VPLSIAVEVRYEDGTLAKKIFTSPDDAIGFLKEKAWGLASAPAPHSLHGDSNRDERSRKTHQRRPAKAKHIADGSGSACKSRAPTN